MGDSGKVRVAVVGGGFAGLYCARALGNNARVEVALIDRRNFHLFQPLLYQVATGSLSPANIAGPLRSIVSRKKNVRTLLAEVTGIDTRTKRVQFADGGSEPFDVLVLATGSTHHYFGKDDWAKLAPGLKTIEDATEIRHRVFHAFEKAERSTDPAERQKLLTFVVVGGGPTGVEMAGGISELARLTMRKDFRSADLNQTRVVLIEGQERVLGSFHEKLSAWALTHLEELQVEVHLDCHVVDLQKDHVLFQPDAGKGEPQRIDTETVVWAAGVKASPLGKMLADGLGVKTEKPGRVVVGPDCSVPGHPDYFVLGDLAYQLGKDGKPLPGLAAVAMQQGPYVAKVIDRRARGKSPPSPFRYWDKGTMATIGRRKAVADLSWLKLRGRIAWLGWLVVHVLLLARFENRVLVVFQWFFNYITLNRAARLITGGISNPAAPAAANTNDAGGAAKADAQGGAAGGASETGKAKVWG